MSLLTTKKKNVASPLPNLAENFDLVVLRLCESKSLLQLDGSEIPTKITIQINVGHSVDTQKGAVRIRCECEVFTEHQANNPPTVSISAVYECIYQAKTPKAMSSVNQLLPSFAIGAQFHAWPYLRRHIHQASVDMGVPPILLPLYAPTSVQAIQKAEAPVVKTKSKTK